MSSPGQSLLLWWTCSWERITKRVRTLYPADEAGILRRLCRCVLTGHATLENAAECIEAGAAQYLLKDMCPPLLALATVKQALQRSDQDRLQREKDQLQFQKAGAAAPTE